MTDIEAAALGEEVVALRQWFVAELKRVSRIDHRIAGDLDALDAAVAQIERLLTHDGAIAALAMPRKIGLSLFRSGDPDFAAQSAAPEIDAARGAITSLRALARVERARHDSLKRIARSVTGRGKLIDKAFGSVEKRAVHWGAETFRQFATVASFGKPFERFMCAVLDIDVARRSLVEGQRQAQRDDTWSVDRRQWQSGRSVAPVDEHERRRILSSFV